MNAITISNVAIRQTSNNLYNLNDLHKASGGEKRHEITNWLKLQQTNELIAEISKPGISGLEENQPVIKVVKGGNNRGTFACKELVYAYATWISAKFFLLVIRTFDAVVSGSLKPPAAKTTADERTPLRQAVSALVGLRGVDYSSAYNMVHQRFGVAAIEDLPREKLSDAVQYVHTLTLGGLQGEILDKPHFDPHAENDAVNDLLCVMRYADRLGKYTRKLAQHLHILDSGLLVHMVTTASEMRRPLKNALHYLEERAAGLPVNGMYNNAKFARQVLEDFHNPAIS